MGTKTALEVNYDVVRSTAKNIKKSGTGKMNTAKSNISKMPQKLTKGNGKTKNAISKQATAEANMMKEMITLCSNISKSIDNVASSYEKMDLTLSSKLEYKEEK